MDRITLLDAAVGSTNQGDEIIMRCVEEELSSLLQRYFVLRVPTHLCAFNALECLGSMPDSASEVANSKYKFVCGTNILQGNMLHRTNQWDINLFNARPIVGSILVGVGSSDSTATWYTKKLYRKVLSDEYYHSARDLKAHELIQSLGKKSLYTGCVTMWKLTPEFCAAIPTEKQKNVIFTLTDYKKSPDFDKLMIETIRNHYEKKYFWIQGIHDYEYLQSLTDTSDIVIVAPNVNSYAKILSLGEDEKVDYVGTRLHAGIFAMRHQVRSIILSVDERMEGMLACIPNNMIKRNDVSQLSQCINSSVKTICNIDWKNIEQWKGQFE